MSPAARFSRSLTKLLRRAQKSNATATEAIGICPALRWTRKKYEPGDLRWLHKAISNLKAFLLGTYHGRCTQLQSYLDEFCFRFNRRKTGNQIFMRLARGAATSCALLC